MTEEELRIEYEDRKPTLLAWGSWVIRAVMDGLEEMLGSKEALDKFLQMQPKSRMKDTDSFLEKSLIRKKKKDPLKEITDQIGVRFIVLLLEDIKVVGRVIESRSWEYSLDRSHDEERLQKPDLFAYQSDHYVVWSPAKLKIDGISVPAGIPCEIQIRTILQHAYAEMAHRCDYKPEYQLPDDDQRLVKRSLAKGSALIETTDDVFKEIKDRIRNFANSTDALLVSAADIYKEFTGETANADSVLARHIADRYRAALKEVTPEQLRVWAHSRTWIGLRLKEKRHESVLYRDSIIIIVGYLISDDPDRMWRLWPLDGALLDELYPTFGQSTMGRF